MVMLRGLNGGVSDDRLDAPDAIVVPVGCKVGWMFRRVVSVGRSALFLGGFVLGSFYSFFLRRLFSLSK